MSFPIITPPTIRNGCNYPLINQAGTVPNMMESITDYMQKLSFEQLVTTVVGFESVQTPTITQFFGVFMPFVPREQTLLPEGQRAWTWIRLYTILPLTLNVDDVVVFPQLNNKQTRVMFRNDYGLYSFIEYKLVQDWSGSGP